MCPDTFFSITMTFLIQFVSFPITFYNCFPNILNYLYKTSNSQELNIKYTKKMCSRKAHIDREQLTKHDTVKS